MMNVSIADVINRPQKYAMPTPQKPVAARVKLDYEPKEASKKVKIGVAVSSFIGMSAALAMIVKHQGFSLDPKIMKRFPIKDWAIFRIASKNKPNRKLLKIEEKEILALAGGSVAGGLLGGALFDRKNMKAKFRESLTQMVGNVITPVAFVGGASRLYEKYETQIKAAMPDNKFMKNLPAIGITFVALGTGIITGSKVTNFINEKLFGQKKEREIKTSDFAPHVDDLCLAVTLMGAKDSAITSTITRTVPLFLSVPGYQVGKAQEQV